MITISSRFSANKRISRCFHCFVSFISRQLTETIHSRTSHRFTLNWFVQTDETEASRKTIVNESIRSENSTLSTSRTVSVLRWWQTVRRSDYSLNRKNCELCRPTNASRNQFLWGFFHRTFGFVNQNETRKTFSFLVGFWRKIENRVESRCFFFCFSLFLSIKIEETKSDLPSWIPG